MKNLILTPTPAYNFKEYTTEDYLEKAAKDCLKDFAETLFGEYLKQDLSIDASFFFHFIELKYATQMDIDPSLERLKIYINPKELMDYCQEFKPAVTDMEDNNYVYSQAVF